jgi:hypothetical protein
MSMMQNLTIFVLILFLSLYFLFVDSRTAEQNLALDFHGTFWSEEVPDGFDTHTADVVACARCDSTHDPPPQSIRPKPETRRALSLGERTKEQSRINAVTEAKLSEEKHKRQVAMVDTIPVTHPIRPEKDANEIDTGNFLCVMEHAHGRRRCDFMQCWGNGGRCQRMIHNGQDGCNQTRLLQNGDMVQIWWARDLPSCTGCRCKKDKKWEHPRGILDYLGPTFQ